MNKNPKQKVKFGDRAKKRTAGASQPSYLKLQAFHEGRYMKFVVHENGIIASTSEIKTPVHRRVPMEEVETLLHAVISAFCYVEKGGNNE